MKYLILTILLLFSIQTFSQYTLKGKIKDYKSSVNIPFANVIIDTLYKRNTMNNNLLGGANTSKNGQFVIENITEKVVKLKTSYIGYTSIIIDNIPLIKYDTLDIGTTYLLAAVLVAGKEIKDGDIKNYRKKGDKPFKIRYPKKGKKIKIRKKSGAIIIDYEDLVKWQNK